MAAPAGSSPLVDISDVLYQFTSGMTRPSLARGISDELAQKILSDLARKGWAIVRAQGGNS